LRVSPGSRNSIICRKQGYKLDRISLNTPDFQGRDRRSTMTGTMTDDISLDATTERRELWGFVGLRKEGVTVKLYRKEGEVYRYIDTAVTCYDGIYAFSELADGVYKISPECSVCTFGPAFRNNVQIPCTATASFNFAAGCTPGACQ
jgi:hypothetical protein